MSLRRLVFPRCVALAVSSGFLVSTDVTCIPNRNTCSFNSVLNLSLNFAKATIMQPDDS